MAEADLTPPPLRVVVALDSFKGSLSSRAAGEAVRAGVLEAASTASVGVFAIADGGEGTLDALSDAVAARQVETSTVDAVGKPILAHYLRLVHDEVSVIEAARTIGVEQQVVDTSLPPAASSAGLGIQLVHALSSTRGPVLVGLGGTATTDGGAGMLRAMGARVNCSDGGPHNLLWTFDSLDIETLPNLRRVIVLSDVTNPLLGPNGAVRVFGPQKGVDDRQSAHLEDQMRRWASSLSATGHTFGQGTAAGAAGGVGAALIACGATVVPGFSEIARRIGLAAAIRSADLVITGEGSLDFQTAMGKGPAGVAALAHSAGATAIGLAGRVERPARSPFDAVFPIHGQPRTLAEAMDSERTLAELRDTAREVVGLVVRSRSTRHLGRGGGRP